MYSKSEKSALRQAFWTALGQYLKPLPSATGENIHWLNYKTGVKDIYLRMMADERDGAWSGFVITHQSEEERNQAIAVFKRMQRTTMSFLKDCVWEENISPPLYGHVLSRIGKGLDGFSPLRKEDWPELISFFKREVIGFDAFWAEARHAFEAD